MQETTTLINDFVIKGEYIEICKVPLYKRTLDSRIGLSVLNDLTIQYDNGVRPLVIGRVANLQDHAVGEEVITYGTIILDVGAEPVISLLKAGIAEVCLTPHLVFLGGQSYRAVHWSFTVPNLEGTPVISELILKPKKLDFTLLKDVEEMKEVKSECHTRLEWKHRKQKEQVQDGKVFINVDGIDYTREDVHNIIMFYETFKGMQDRMNAKKL